MTNDRELLQQALDALEGLLGWQSLAPAEELDNAKAAAFRIRARLAQPEREWQGLAIDEIEASASLGVYAKPLIEFARAIEAKLKEKNATASPS